MAEAGSDARRSASAMGRARRWLMETATGALCLSVTPGAAALAFAVAFTSAPGAAQTTDAAGAAPGEVVAILDSAAEAEAFVDLAEARRYRLIKQYDLEGLGLQLVALGVPEPLMPGDAIVELEGIAPYSTVGRNHAYRLSDAAKPRLFARAAIGWPDQACAVEAKLGVIDAPVDPDRLGLPRDDFASESFLRAGEAASLSDHGASVAGIMAGDAGLLTDVTLYAAEAVLDDEAGEALARVDHMARSIDWMAANGVRVVNISLAGPRNKILAKVVEAAAARGMILVAAAGNAGPEADPLYPAAFKEVIAVTAVDVAQSVFRDANRGPHIDIAAPGVDIWLFGVSEQRYASGTSLAAPFVAARLSIAAATGEATDVGSARALLAREAQDLGEAGHDPVFGAGLLRAAPSC